MSRLHELADRLRGFAVGPRPDLREIADELDVLDRLRAGEGVLIDELKPPPFIRDPLNWEGRVTEAWRCGDPTKTLIGEQFFLVEDEPGRVHVTTDQLRELLTRSGFEKTGDI